MLRVAAVHLLLFLLPFAVYGLYLVLTRTRLSQTQFVRGPFGWLAAAGLTVTAAGFLILGGFGGGEGGSYRPAQYIDGELVPGRVE